MSTTDPPDNEPPLPPAPATDPNATVMFTAEDVAKLKQEAEAVEQSANEDDPLLGTLIRDKWKVLQRLGAGSFGTVYKVEDVEGGWTEALKILGVDRLTGSEAEEVRARFLREAQIMKRLGRESQHIVGLSTYEEDLEAGLIYFLMEFVEGRSLAAALREEGPFPVERTIHLALQVCDALMAAHEGPEPVVHRDLKLENLMLTTDRTGAEMIKVLDFGIAKIAEREADSRLTTVGTLGTPGYAAPEQLRAEDVDGRTDLFAFGVILYALLTGRDPWLGNLAHEPTHQIYELMVATDRAEVRPVGETGAAIPAAMVNVVMKLLRRDPAQRFQSARELRDALQAVATGAPVAAPETAVPRSPARTAAAPASASGREDVLASASAGEGASAPDSRPHGAAAPGSTPHGAAAPGSTPQDAPAPDLSRQSAAAPASGREGAPDASRHGAPASRPRPRAKRRSWTAGVTAALVVVAGAGATVWAQPWGRTLSVEGLLARARSGAVSEVWVTDGGLEGGLRLLPMDAAAELLMAFFTPVSEGELHDVVGRLREAGVTVDVSREIERLTSLAVEAQARNRYFGLPGGDVRTFAVRLAELVPGNPVAVSLLLKVGERMAWDAEAAAPDRARELVQECLGLVPDHPRCLEVSGAL